MTTMQAFSDELARLRARPASVARRRPLLTTLAVLAARVVAAAPRARTLVMSVTGFGCLVSAAWVTFGVGAGLAATGLSVLVLEWLTDGQSSGSNRR